MSKLFLGASCALIYAIGLPGNDKGAVADAVKNATYVFVTTNSGDVFSPNVTPEDRHAVADVQNAIEKWGRYRVVYRRDEADVILVVRTGRAAEVHGGVQVGIHDAGRSAGGEVGDPQDTLEVYMASSSAGSPPLWRSRAKDGLKPPEVQLMRDFRSQVEAVSKKQKR